MIRFALRIPEDLHARLTARAAADRRSINSEILHLLDAALSTPTETADAPDAKPTSAPQHENPGSSPA
ncbi:Arc family DNA-binding protein [Streptomyces sp. NRRL S-646]|uniref:Arc family DNA-binding protein n=1 Tax=Streptomyces sp. NRRL S-646 TaxID=1463917 RepID=UPI00099C9229|nr:Arc family DNA-binding protein [Streptomyces sp. NRRL S-646]